MAEKTRCQYSAWQFGETSEIGSNLAKSLVSGGKKPILSFYPSSLLKVPYRAASVHAAQRRHRVPCVALLSAAACGRRRRNERVGKERFTRNRHGRVRRQLQQEDPGRRGGRGGEGSASDKDVEEGEGERDGVADHHRLAAHEAAVVLTAPLVAGEGG